MLSQIYRPQRGLRSSSATSSRKAKANCHDEIYQKLQINTEEPQYYRPIKLAIEYIALPSIPTANQSPPRSVTSHTKQKPIPMAQVLRTLYRAINPANTITKHFRPQTSLRQQPQHLPQTFRSFTSTINRYSPQTFTTNPPPGTKMRAYWYDNLEVSWLCTRPPLHDFS